jgi:pimeloyl-ACP methyl ester carboxylesterase
MTMAPPRDLLFFHPMTVFAAAGEPGAFKHRVPLPTMHFEQTELLNIAFEMEGSPSGPPVLLLHGWPDAPAGWKYVASRLQECGFRTVAPYLRGSYPTEFLSGATPRFAGGVAIAQGMIELANNPRREAPAAGADPALRLLNSFPT